MLEEPADACKDAMKFWLQKTAKQFLDIYNEKALRKTKRFFVVNI